jgi:hypothetical protein
MFKNKLKHNSTLGGPSFQKTTTFDEAIFQVLASCCFHLVAATYSSSIVHDEASEKFKALEVEPADSVTKHHVGSAKR